MLSNPYQLEIILSANFVNPSVYKIGIPYNKSCAGAEVSIFFLCVKDQEFQVFLKHT